MKNATYKKFVSQPEKELELNGLEAPDKHQMDTVTQHATKPVSEKSKPTCVYHKLLSHNRNQCRHFRRGRPIIGTKNSPRNNKNGQTNSHLNNNNVTKSNNNNTNNRNNRKPRTDYTPCETCGKVNHFTKNCPSGANAANNQPPW